jgi:hypothetical protein
MTTNDSIDNIPYKPSATAQSTPKLRKAHCLYDKTFVVLQDDVVKSLSIDEGTWFEQILTEDGILLKIRRLPFDLTFCQGTP